MPLPILSARALGQARHQPVGHPAHRHRHRDRHAALAGRAVGCADQRVDRLVEVGIGHHHQVVLGAAQGLHALAAPGAFRINVLGDRRAADKGHGLHIRMGQQRIHRVLAALHNVEHAIGQAGLLEQVGDHQAGARIALARLEHEGVAARQRDREHPHRHHDREVERRDAGHHAQRLAQVPVVDAAADVVGELGLEQVRDAAGEFHHLNAARDLALGIGEHLAVLARDGGGQGIVMLVEQFLELEQDARALERRGLGPGRRGGVGGGHGGIHLGLAAQQHLCRHGAGGGVEHIGAARGGAGMALSADVVADHGFGHGGINRSVHLRLPLAGRYGRCRRCVRFPLR